MKPNIECVECLLYGRHPCDCSTNPLACIEEMRKRGRVQMAENYSMYEQPNPLGWDEVSPHQF